MTKISQIEFTAICFNSISIWFMWPTRLEINLRRSNRSNLLKLNMNMPLGKHRNEKQMESYATEFFEQRIELNDIRI